MKITLLQKIEEMGHDKDKATRIIMSGMVKVNENVVFTPSETIQPTDSIVLKKTKEWVSRGAYKLLSAIEKFNIDFNNKVVLDIGSSAGGFSEVSLKSGASHVFALDVGTNQLDYKLRSDERVTVMEKTNLKTIRRDLFDKEIDVVVTDVSFISLKHVFNVLKDIGDKNLQVMALIKPQFEANSDQVMSGGIVSEELHEEIIDKVKAFAAKNKFELKKIDKSPITGKKIGNIEYITLFERANNE